MQKMDPKHGTADIFGIDLKSNSEESRDEEQIAYEKRAKELEQRHENERVKRQAKVMHDMETLPPKIEKDNYLVRCSIPNEMITIINQYYMPLQELIDAYLTYDIMMFKLGEAESKARKKELTKRFGYKTSDSGMRKMEINIWLYKRSIAK